MTITSVMPELYDRKTAESSRQTRFFFGFSPVAFRQTEMMLGDDGIGWGQFPQVAARPRAAT
jgi:hypothetical protein